MRNKPLPQWAVPATAAAVPSIYAAQKLMRGGVPNPFVIAAAAGIGYALPRTWNEVVARHTDDAEFEKEMRQKKNEIVARALNKEAGFLSGIGGVVGKGIKYLGAAAKDVVGAVAAKPAAGAGLGQKLLRPLALGGVAAGGYMGGKYLVNKSKPYNYATYERNLVNYGHISPSEMSRSGFNAMVKAGNLIGGGMNLLMGGFAIKEGVAAAKKIKTPVMGSAIQQSKVYGDAGGTMNNFR